MSDAKKEMKSPVSDKLLKNGLGLLLALLAGLAVADFNDIARLVGHFSTRWQIGLAGFSLLCAGLLAVLFAAVWLPPSKLRPFLGFRNRLGALNWAAALLAPVLAVWIFQYSFWGTLLRAPSIHLIFYAAAAVWAAFWFCRSEQALFDFPALLVGLLVTGCVFSLASAFIVVRNYPFPVYWSEGNRLWDYSILFGRSRYNFPADLPIPVSIDVGRQIIWGLPFLLPGLPIWAARFWSALVSTLPYALLGWAAFSYSKSNRLPWLACGLWAYLFLAQTAIYTPLIVSAILIGLAWRSPFRRAVLLTAAGALFAYVSRTTWMIAPLLWIAMLEGVQPQRHDSLKGDGYQIGRIPLRGLELSAVALLAGIAAPASFAILLNDRLSGMLYLAGVSLYTALILGLAYLAYRLWLRWNPQGRLRSGLLALAGTVVLAAGGAVAISVVTKHAAAAAEQPLLWSRLLPNSTYGLGILLALAVAALPLLLLLGYLAIGRKWSWRRLDAALIVLPLLAFLAMGLVASVKIGGGSNLHNLDMFFVDLVFLAALAWEGGGAELFSNRGAARAVQALLAVLVILPAIQPVAAMSPLVLVTRNEANKALRRVQAEVEAADLRGPILFMDHRQLLTFGYVKNVTLLPEYEKKIVMDYAMAGDEAYFEKFYADLAKHRFALIISDPLKVSFAENRQEDTGFGEENDAWVTWVAEPVLRYYEPLEQFKGIGLQLLVPRP